MTTATLSPEEIEIETTKIDPKAREASEKFPPAHDMDFAAFKKEKIFQPSGRDVPQQQAPVKPGDTLTGSTTIDQMIAALYQTNTLGTPASYIWIDPTCLAVTYSHQSVIYIRLTGKPQYGGTTYKLGLT